MSDREYGAQCEFIRHGFDRLIQWFTAFIAVNMLAFGWIITQELSVAMMVVLAVWMALQNVLGVLATARVRRELVRATNRVQQLLRQDEQSPVPIALFALSADLIRWALVLTTLVWATMPPVRLLTTRQ